MDNFIFQQLIGRGTYGKVYKAVCQKNKMTVAIKKIPVNPDVIPETIITEVMVLRSLQIHPNIINLYDIWRNESHVYLVMQYALFDLADYLKIYLANTIMDADRIKSYLYQILHGILYCHAHKILHGDIKPRNVLLYPNDIIKITDFGMAKATAIRLSMHKKTVASLWYRAPELLFGATDYGLAVDMWSIGCIFAEMATKIPLFNGYTEIGQLFKIFETLGTPSERSWPDIIRLPYYQKGYPTWRMNIASIHMDQIDDIGMNLFQMMLLYNPAKRISSIEAIGHPYFYNMDKESRQRDLNIYMYLSRT